MATPKKSEGPSISMFSVAQDLVQQGLGEAAGLNEFNAEQSLLIDPSEYISFNKPTDVIVSKHYPGYKIFDLSGNNADEALGQLLANSLDSDSSLEEFRALMSSPDIASSVIMKLFPRAAVPLRRGKYLISEETVGTTVADALDGRTADSNVVTAVAHVFTKVLSKMDLILVDNSKKIVATSDSFAITMDGMKRIIMLESLKELFSDQFISIHTSKLTQDTTPILLAEILSRLFRRTSQAIPEIRLHLEQLDIVKATIQRYYKAPNELSNTVKSSSALAILAGYSNFLEASAVPGSLPEKHITWANADLVAALNSILLLIQSSPSIEAVSMNKFAEHFGTVPCSSSEGIYRGVVVYMVMGQKSELDVVESYDRSIGVELGLVPTEYVPATSIAQSISTSLCSPETFEGMANLVADEISNASWALDDTPVLRTIGVSKVDLLFLAMSKAETTAVINTDSDLFTFKMVFAARVAEQWRTRLGAATPDIAYFGNPSSVVVYTSGSERSLPTTLPTRSQTVDLTAAVDLLYLGAPTFVQRNVERPFSFNLDMLTKEGGKTVTKVLKCRVSMFKLLIGQAASMSANVGSSYGIVNEPGVDKDTRVLLALAAAYASSNDVVASDRAKSWIVETLEPLVTHPAVTRLAILAVNEAIVRGEIDARRNAIQTKQVIIRAYFATLLGMLERFSKVDANVSDELMKHIPISALSVKAAISLATMPMLVNASDLVESK